MASLQLSVAFSATEKLLVRAERGDVVSDTLPDPMRTPLATSYTKPMLQPLIDRVEALNWLVRHR